MQCGDCENFVYMMVGAYGRCSKKPLKGGGYEKVMMNMDASKCSMFKQIDRVETDTRQSSVGVHFRPPEYGYEEKKADTKVDPNKTKDSKQWG